MSTKSYVSLKEIGGVHYDLAVAVFIAFITERAMKNLAGILIFVQLFEGKKKILIIYKNY